MPRCTTQARCTRRAAPGGEEKEVLRLKQHDYFGERALLNDEPRAVERASERTNERTNERTSTAQTPHADLY
jgi:CRP-like cAMP-binding protein